jgi:hypothetical protein
MKGGLLGLETQLFLLGGGAEGRVAADNQSYQAIYTIVVSIGG